MPALLLLLIFLSAICEAGLSEERQREEFSKPFKKRTSAYFNHSQNTLRVHDENKPEIFQKEPDALDLRVDKRKDPAKVNPRRKLSIESTLNPTNSSRSNDCGLQAPFTIRTDSDGSGSHHNQNKTKQATPISFTPDKHNGETSKKKRKSEKRQSHDFENPIKKKMTIYSDHQERTRLMSYTSDSEVLKGGPSSLNSRVNITKKPTGKESKVKPLSNSVSISDKKNHSLPIQNIIKTFNNGSSFCHWKMEKRQVVAAPSIPDNHYRETSKKKIRIEKRQSHDSEKSINKRMIVYSDDHSEMTWSMPYKGDPKIFKEKPKALDLQVKIKKNSARESTIAPLLNAASLLHYKNNNELGTYYTVRTYSDGSSFSHWQMKKTQVTTASSIPDKHNGETGHALIAVNSEESNLASPEASYYCKPDLNFNCVNEKNRINRASVTCVEQNNIGKKTYKCKYCHMRFYHSSNRSRHQKTHRGEKPFKCQYCDKCFTQDSHRNRHEQTLHTRKNISTRTD